jgi:hypothetical protein
VEYEDEQRESWRDLLVDRPFTGDAARLRVDHRRFGQVLGWNNQYTFFKTLKLTFRG